MVSKGCGIVKNSVQTVGARAGGSTKKESASAGSASGRTRTVHKNGGAKTVAMGPKISKLNLISSYVNPRQPNQKRRVWAGVRSRNIITQVYGSETSRIDSQRCVICMLKFLQIKTAVA